MKRRVAGKIVVFVLLLILLPLIAVEYYGVSGSPYSSPMVLSAEGDWLLPEQGTITETSTTISPTTTTETSTTISPTTTIIFAPSTSTSTVIAYYSATATTTIAVPSYSIVTTSVTTTGVVSSTRTTTASTTTTSTITTSATESISLATTVPLGAIVSITIDSSPEMPDTVSVDGTAISTPQTYSWQVGTAHSLYASSTASYYGGQDNFQFQYWENEYTGQVVSYSQMYTYTVPDNSQTVVAIFETQGQGQGNACLQYVGNVCEQWQGNNMGTITQLMSYTRTKYATATMTTTGYATTQVSSITLANTLYTTQIQYSLGTDTITSYVYVESYLSSGQSADVMNVATSSGQQSLFPQLPFSIGHIPRVGIFAMIGAAIALTVLMVVRRKKRRNAKAPEKHPDKIGLEGLQRERVVDYVASHEGSISMRQASQDLGIPAEDLTGILQELKAEGRLKPT